MSAAFERDAGSRAEPPSQDTGPVTPSAAPAARPPRALLWFGVAAPPLAWVAQLYLVYYLSSLDCASGFRWFRLFGTSGFAIVNLFFTLAMLLIAIGAGLVSWSIWRRSDAAITATLTGTDGRVAFMALGGVVLSCLFTLLIIMSGVPNMTLGCAL